MKRTSKDSVIVITRVVNNSDYSEPEYFTKIRKVNNFINLLVCAGFNEDELNHSDYFQVWTGKKDGDKVAYEIVQNNTNYDAGLRSEI